MKRKLLLSAFLAVISLHQAVADHLHTVLNVSMFDGRPITVVIDGRQNGPLANEQRIVNLTPGIHRIKVYGLVHYPHSWFPQKRLVYQGRIEIIPGHEIDARINRHHRLVIQNVTALYNVPKPVYGQGWCGTNTSVTHHGGHGYSYHEPVHYMREADFNELLRVIHSKSFESTKAQIARQVIASNYFTSAQIRELLGLFTFESTKLEIAKYAYERVVDQDRYYLVYDSFTFESSINSLSAFVGY